MALEVRFGIEALLCFSFLLVNASVSLNGVSIFMKLTGTALSNAVVSD